MSSTRNKIGLSDISVQRFNYSRKYYDIHDKYVYRYNGNNSKIEFTSDLVALREGYQKQTNLINEKIESNISTLTWQVGLINETLWESKYSQKSEEMDIDNEVVEKIQDVQNWLRSILNPVNNEFGTEIDSIKALKASYKNLFKTIDESEIIHDNHFTLIQRSLNLSQEHHIISLHNSVLTYLINEIALQNYPDELKPFEELSEDEKEKIRKNSRNYSQHQSNKQWVKDRFQELEEEKTEMSQNQRLDKIIDEYKKQFEMSISKSRVLSYAGKYEYQ